MIMWRMMPSVRRITRSSSWVTPGGAWKRTTV